MTHMLPPVSPYYSLSHTLVRASGVPAEISLRGAPALVAASETSSIARWLSSAINDRDVISFCVPVMGLVHESGTIDGDCLRTTVSVAFSGEEGLSWYSVVVAPSPEDET